MQSIDQNDSALFKHLLAKASPLFSEDEAQTKRWLSTPLAILGGQAPYERAQNEEGLKEVQDLIGRLLHGVFS
ncbi:DUF2384 domain-containing protein [Alcanivorax sp. VBW004]|uniref:Antitoxin Xre/MbcA/ParS-like toxin-binding domain-containing protein n=1 Tax=Alcanivorax jadensis T9 TaxID=1177181 RepID=A0ABR4WFN9_9GAMM|nr:MULTISPECIES: MbcA/ParS/Xre antitoxin family protein [Alcanivorax]KGD62388.1 hypothetical protein T9A_00679 [Alcanivorax jadensis T9]MTT51579.1 DUF2384 domain-containing protein [Alcanivorax sp. VBW004]